jgi:hypothetical protein
MRCQLAAEWLIDQTLTGHAATLTDVGNVAPFAASDLAHGDRYDQLDRRGGA